MKFLYTVIVLTFFISCSLFEEETPNSSCPNGDCWVRLYTDFEVDSNGYHHVEPFWYSQNSGRFNLHIESSPTLEICHYHGVPYVTSKFNSDTYWEVESGLSFTFGLYNPFESLYTQQGNIIKVRDTTVTIDYFQGEIIPIVQDTYIRMDIKNKVECYGEENPRMGTKLLDIENCSLYSKRIVGPLIRDMVGDTIKIYSNTYFDCSPDTFVKDSISVIIK